MSYSQNPYKWSSYPGFPQLQTRSEYRELVTTADIFTVELFLAPLPNVFDDAPPPMMVEEKKEAVLTWLKGSYEWKSPTGAPYIRQPLSDHEMQMFIKENAQQWELVSVFSRGVQPPRDLVMHPLIDADRWMTAWLKDYFADPRSKVKKVKSYRLV